MKTLLCGIALAFTFVLAAQQPAQAYAMCCCQWCFPGGPCKQSHCGTCPQLCEKSTDSYIDAAVKDITLGTQLFQRSACERSAIDRQTKGEWWQEGLFQKEYQSNGKKLNTKLSEDKTFESSNYIKKSK